MTFRALEHSVVRHRAGGPWSTVAEGRAVGPVDLRLEPSSTPHQVHELGEWFPADVLWHTGGLWADILQVAKSVKLSAKIKSVYFILKNK